MVIFVLNFIHNMFWIGVFIYYLVQDVETMGCFFPLHLSHDT